MAKAGKQAIVKMGKMILPVALKISGTVNNKYSRALGYTAIEFMAASPTQRAARANNLVGAMINFEISAKPSEKNKRAAAVVLNKVKRHAPAHYDALWWASVRAAPKAIYKVLRA